MIKIMKTKLAVLVGLMALSAAGTVGGALALTRNSATGSGTAGNFDKAIYLYWGNQETTASLDDVNDLSAGVAQYRYLSVMPKSSKSVSGTVTLTFTLASGGANTHMEGLTVNVYKTDALANDSTVAAAIDGKSASPVLTKSNLSGTISFSVATSESIHVTDAYYAIEVVWSGSNDAEHPTYELGASLTISQAFAA